VPPVGVPFPPNHTHGHDIPWKYQKYHSQRYYSTRYHNVRYQSWFVLLEDHLTKDKKPGPGRGGAREGGGRPKGSRNKALVAREIATKNAIDDTLARLTEEEIQRLTPLEIMILAMHLMLQSHNLMGAVSVAKEAAPYVHPKVASVVHDVPLPEDLRAQPEPTPDDDNVPPLVEGDGRDDERALAYWTRRVARKREDAGVTEPAD
jgi:hypothetical protein